MLWWSKESGHFAGCSRKLDQVAAYPISGLPSTTLVPVSPIANQESLHHEEEPAGTSHRAPETEDQRARVRPRRRRDLGSRLQAQRRAQRAGWVDADENEEAGVQGERVPIWDSEVREGALCGGKPGNRTVGHLICGSR